MYAYRNRNTGQVHIADEKTARFEGLSNWTLLEGDEAAQALEGVDEAAFERARAERESIERAAGARAAIVDAEGLGKAAAEKVRATSADAPALTVTSAHSIPAEPTPTEGVLGRAKADQKAGRTQVGPDPERHASTKEEVAEVAAEQDEPAGDAKEDADTEAEAEAAPRIRATRKPRREGVAS